MENSFEQNNEQENNSEDLIISSLEQEIIGMEERYYDIRKDGKGDPKYEILFRFIKEAKEKGFDSAYNNLNDIEKHAIITRLENQSFHGNISYDFVKKIREDFYGMVIGPDGKSYMSHEKQYELEKALQDIWSKDERNPRRGK